MQDAIYWQRRAEIAETVLESLAATSDERSPDFMLWRDLAITAERVLAERRKDMFERENIEDLVRAMRQKKLWAWVLRTWGPGEEIVGLEQRGTRFAEECVELVDAVRNLYLQQTGNIEVLSREEYLTELFAKLIRHVVRKPADTPEREIGGVMVTLYTLAEALGLQVTQCEKDEHVRVLAIPKSEFATRHQAKVDAGM